MKNTIASPDFATVLKERENRISANINCIQIGQIESYDIATQSATINIQVRRRKSDTEIIAYPLLLDCPVVVMQGGGTFMEFPIASGDFCLVLFNDRDIDSWWTGPSITEPKTKRKHSLSDGFALVGVNPKTQALDLEGDAVGINAGSKKVRIKNSAEDILALMDDLIDAVKAIITTGSPSTQAVSAASQAALDAIKTRIGALFVS